ncbi:MAG: hypothetical protein ACYDBY_17645 [Thermoanaerobaculia bacterium]
MAPAVARLGPAMHVTVEDLLPLVAKLTRDERIRLAQLALQFTGSEEREASAAAYRKSSALAHEFADLEDPLSWDADGWEDAERAVPPGIR